MAKIAIKRVRKGEDGKLTPYYIDVETLQPISDIEGYQIINPEGDPEFSGFDAVIAAQGEGFLDWPTTPPKPASGGPKSAKEKEVEDRFNRSRGEKDKSSGGKGSIGGKKSQGNNFGYINKPGWLGLAGFIPGPAGTIAKAANLGINANNISSVNAAREYIGAEPLGFKDTVKGLMKDQKGFVDRVKINKQDYTVGLEAMHKGKTTLTPEEAVKRGLTLDGIQNQKGKTIMSSIAAGVTESMFEGKPITNERELNEAIAKGNNTTRNLSKYAPDETPQAVGFMPSYGQHRPASPKQSLIDNVRTSVANVYGPGANVVGTSGLGNYGSHRHRKGDALDFDVYDEGNMRQQYSQPMQDVAMDFAARNPTAGVGFAPGYMDLPNGDTGRMHLDTANDPATWGKNETKDGLVGGPDGTFAQNIQFARETGIGPTPTFDAPTPTARGMDPGPATATGGFMGQQQIASIGQPQGSQTQAVGLLGTGFGGNVKSQVGDKFADLGQMAPAEMASKGLIERSPREREAITRTVVGELSAESLAGLARGEETAHRELANMVTAIENRVASNRYNNSVYDVVTAPAQFNALDPGALPTTKANYAQYGNVVRAKVDSFYTPEGIKPDSWGFTSFHANFTNPDWSGLMGDKTIAGEHTFGTLGEYGPSSGFMSERDRLSNAQVSDTRGFTPSSTAGAFAGRTADSRGTFGTDRSPGFGRSAISSGSKGGAFADRSPSGFGTSSSPGYGRSSFAGGSSNSGGYGRSSPEGGGGGSSNSGGGYSGRGPSGFGTSSSPGVGRSSISGGSTGSHPGASVGHSGTAGGAGGHSGSKNDRGGFAGL